MKPEIKAFVEAVESDYRYGDDIDPDVFRGHSMQLCRIIREQAADNERMREELRVHTHLDARGAGLEL